MELLKINQWQKGRIKLKSHFLFLMIFIALATLSDVSPVYADIYKYVDDVPADISIRDFRAGLKTELHILGDEKQEE